MRCPSSHQRSPANFCLLRRLKPPPLPVAYLTVIARRREGRRLLSTGRSPSEAAILGRAEEGVDAPPRLLLSRRLLPSRASARLCPGSHRQRELIMISTADAAHDDL